MKVAPILEGLEGDKILGQYVEPAREVTLVRLIKEVGCYWFPIWLNFLFLLLPTMDMLLNT